MQRASTEQATGREVTGQVLGGLRRIIRFGLDDRIAAAVRERVEDGADVEAFAARWIEAGHAWEARADAAAADGRLVTARHWYRQAFYLYRVADFAYTDNAPPKLEAFDALQRSFTAATSGIPPAPEAVEVEALGHRFEGMLVLPQGGDAVPVCLFIYGSDGIKEEHYWQSALPLVARGVGVLVVDGPGQGAAIRRDGVPARADYERFASACVDFLVAEPRVVSSAIGVMGSSAGGYYAPRAFATDTRLCALQVNSALHTPLEGSWIHYPAARPQLRYNVQAMSDDEASRIYTEFTLTGLTNADASRPARIYHGDQDPRIPVEQAHKLGAFLGDRAEVIIWEGADHNLGNVSAESHPQMWDWMAARLREAAGRR